MYGQRANVLPPIDARDAAGVATAESTTTGSVDDVSDATWPSAPPDVPPEGQAPVRGFPAGGSSAPFKFAPPSTRPIASSGFPAAGRTTPFSGSYATTPVAPGRPAGPPPFDPGPSRRTVALGAMAVVLVIALVATLMSLTSSSEDRVETARAAAGTSSTSRGQVPDTTNPPTTTPGPAPSPGIPSFPPPTLPSGPPASSEAINAEVVELSKFVEKERGLRFQQPVDVEVLSSREFIPRLTTMLDEEVAAIEAQGRLYRALGLAPPDFDAVVAQEALLGAGVMGFYLPATGALVVRGQQITPFWRRIVVHELTHALDDQNLGLDRPDLSARTDGSEWAFQALAEGSARRVELAYVRSLSENDRAQMQSEMGAMGAGQSALLTASAAFPLRLVVLAEAPYNEGEPFVSALVADGGTTRLDETFSSPPVSSEQILHPEKYRSGELPVVVEAPDADGVTTGNGTLGEYLTGLVLASETMPGDIETLLADLLSGNGNEDFDITDPSALEELLKKAFTTVDTPEGWGGDQYVLWEENSQACIRVHWTWDSPAAKQAFDQRLRTWAGADPLVKIGPTTSDVSQITRCA